MIDNFCILVGTLGALYVVWRAFRLNRSLPWFPPPTKAGEARPADPKAWTMPGRADSVPVWRK